MQIVDKAKRVSLTSGKVVRKRLHKCGIVLPDWIQVLIWSGCVITLIILTLRFSLPIILDYMNDDTNVAIQTDIALNEKFTPPQLIVQVPHYVLSNKTGLASITKHLMNNSGECIQCGQLTNRSWNVWDGDNFDNKDYDTIFSNLVANFTYRMLQTVEHGGNAFPEKYPTWSWPLIESAIYFFSWKYVLDRYQMPPDMNGTENIARVDSYFANNKSIWNGTHIFDIFYTQLLVTLCGTMNLTSSNYFKANRKTCEEILTESFLPVTMDNASLWIPIPTNDSDESVFTCALWQKPWDYNISVWTPPGGLENSSADMWLYSQPLAQYYWEVDNASYLFPYIASGRLRAVYPRLTLTYNVAMKVRENRTGKIDQCYSDINPKMCVQKCSKIWAMRKCKCAPFSFHRGLESFPHNHLPYCTDSNYTACNLTTFNGAPRDECVQNCSNPCEYTTYTFHIVPNEYPSPEQLAFDIFQRPIIDPFVQFSWTTKDKMQDLLSDLGGVLGLYLGLSGISICIFIISCVDFLKHYHRKKAGRANVADMKAISLWQMILLKKSAEMEETEQHSSPQTNGSGTLRSEVKKGHDAQDFRIQLQVLRNEMREQIDILKKENEDIKKELAQARASGFSHSESEVTRV